MIHYKLTVEKPLSQDVQVSLTLEVTSLEIIDLALPAWRPGRYEFQQYARNIYSVQARLNDLPLTIKKTSRNTWQIHPYKTGKLTIEYFYHCTQLDAGGSWIDDELFYINPINCLLYIPRWQNNSCTLSIDAPHWAMDKVCGLTGEDNTFHFPSYFQLADSPFFLSKQLTKVKYAINDYTFNVYIHGTISFDLEKLSREFENFSTAQINAMGSFPEKAYHFLLLLFPFQHYHGVEHHCSTVITLGPSDKLSETELYDELISISSHELYHAWNICKIRPKEMYPYRLQEENYFRTGFVAEGITTYLGEYFLRQSDFFSEERFLLEIEQWLNRHRMHRGVQRASLSDSSFDLWVDGYIATSADYKVSIYVAGALSAISLDLLIRSQDETKNLFDLMRTLYASKALKQEGYDEQYLKEEIKKLIPATAESFWKACIEGHEVDHFVIEQLSNVGISVVEKSSDYLHERLLGIKIKPSANKVEISKIRVDSVAADVFMVDDVIASANGVRVTTLQELEIALFEPNIVEFVVLRKGRELRFTLPVPTTTNHWSSLQVQKNNDASENQKRRYKEWMKAIV